nr:D-hexose-6-phosphate mutarotase [Marinobacter zhejiangensis]
MEALEVRHPEFYARLFLQGAHLSHFAPAGAGNWLWLSDTARFMTGRAIRGGIPVCWPWFGVPGKNPDPVRQTVLSDTPHGFARTAVWNLEDVRESAQDVEISLSLDASQDFAELWGGRASALITFRFAATALQVALTSTNLGRTPLAFSQALHTYLPTPDITRTQITGLDRCNYIDTLDEWSRKRQDTALCFDGEVDRIYDTGGADIGLNTPATAYRLCSSGSRSAVVWNPGPEKSRHLSDFPDTAWQTMLCVETANAFDNIYVLNSGQSHTLSVMISRLEEHKDPS